METVSASETEGPEKVEKVNALRLSVHQLEAEMATMRSIVPRMAEARMC